MGLNRNGIARSLLWSIPFFGLLTLFTIFIGALAVGLLGPGVFTFPYQSSLPFWYAIATIIYNVFSSLTEETIGVGYIVDRLMPAHPASLKASTPAVLVRSTIAVLYHIGTYFVLFRFSLITGLVEFVIAFLGFTFIGFAYVKSRVRNISGPWVMHYLLDVIMVLETFHL